MSLGLCLGGVGLGACKDATRDTSTTTILNTALTYALDQCIFTCKANIDASNKVQAAGQCSCAELGIAPGSAACSSYQANLFAFQSQCSMQLQSNPPKDTTQLQSLICSCRPTSGCNIGISQTSNTQSEQTCSNNATVQNNLSNDFSNHVVDSLESTMSDIGGLFDANNHEVVKNVANQISQNVTVQHISTIENMVNAAQTVSAGCGGVNFGVTQVSRYTNILKVLQTTNDFNTLSGKITDVLSTSITRTNSGFLGWLNGNMTVVIIVAVIIGIVILVFVFFSYKGKIDSTMLTSGNPDVAREYFNPTSSIKWGGFERKRGAAASAPITTAQRAPVAVAAPAPVFAPAQRMTAD
jgi:hypothetical protein